MRHWTPQVYSYTYLTNGIEIRRTVHECDRRQTDRQTDHATEKCLAIGGIACHRAIPPNKNLILTA